MSLDDEWSTTVDEHRRAWRSCSCNGEGDVPGCVDVSMNQWYRETYFVCECSFGPIRWTIVAVLFASRRVMPLQQVHHLTSYC